jgi:predicted transcriptional regulator
MKTLRIGIATLPELKARTLATAAGTHRPGRADPKLWFSSLEGLAKVLSEPNRRLLQLVAEHRPDSLAELSDLSGRAVSNLSRTVATMERFGLLRTRKGKAGRMAIRVGFRSVAIAVPIVPLHAEIGSKLDARVRSRRAAAQRASGRPVAMARGRKKSSQQNNPRS